MSGTVLVIGGTGAMGGPVVRALLAEARREVKVFIRDPDSQRVKALLDAYVGSAERVRRRFRR